MGKQKNVILLLFLICCILGFVEKCSAHIWPVRMASVPGNIDLKAGAELVSLGEGNEIGSGRENVRWSNQGICPDPENVFTVMDIYFTQKQIIKW